MTGEQAAKPAGTHIVLEPDELLASAPAHRQGDAPGDLAHHGGGARATARAATTRPSSVPASAPSWSSSRAGRGRRRGRVRPRVPARRAAGAVPATRTSGCASSARSSAVLDPIVAILDALPSHFDPDYAPRDMLDLLERVAGRRPRREPADHRPAREGPPGRRARPPPRDRRAGWSSRCRSRSRTCRCAWRTTGGVVCRRRASAVEAKPAAASSSTATSPSPSSPGRDRPLHRAVQAGTHLVPAARQGAEEEAV